MNRIFHIFLFGSILLIALVFSLQNLDHVKVYFYRGVGKELAIELPLAWALTLELLAGVVIGISILLIRYLKLKAENARLKKQLLKNMSESTPDD
ncbi:MAG: lipopolysaccharide assembly protein LapA domain-containing protein [Methylococcales bacterium]